MRPILRLAAIAVVLLVVLGVVISVWHRLGSDPTTWLMLIIPAAAAMAFFLQVLKNW